jgi:Fur family ferric uptake transcriptional regulator
VKTTYRTKQQYELMAYLQQHPGAHHTAAQIKEYFARQDKNIGTATIYRQLERFVEDGTVRKYLLETGDSACYEYMEESDSCSSHFHCKCEKCGKLIHLDCHELQEIYTHLIEHHGFAWNTGKTVFYGICKQCRTD